MFTKLLIITVIWLEANYVSAKDIYELEFWSRDPKFSNKRRSFNLHDGHAKPPFRHSKIVLIENGTTELMRRIRKPMRERTEATTYRSTRIHPTPMRLVQHPPGHKDSDTEPLNTAKDKNEEVDESLEKLSVYSLKKSMEQISNDLGRECNITVEVLGRTFEYNDIVILKMAEKKSAISKYFRSSDNKYIDEVPEKKIIFIVHGLTTKGILQLPCLSRRKRFLQLLNYYLDHLDQFDIYLIPVANPDGFTEAFNDQSWNKNMSPQSTCNGVALDRNFDVAWGGSSNVGACSQNYPGPSAFSEAETKAVRDVFHRYGHKIAAYIHVHSGSYIPKTFKGEAVLYPKGFTETQTDDDKYMDMKGEIDETMRNASFQRMTVTTDSLYRWYGKVTGTSVDYAATVFGIPFAMEFVMETYDLGLESRLQNAALTAVWKKVIDAVFNFIHKKGDGNDAKKR